MERERGFSLIELLIVVAIILIIAAIAIPNLLSARIQANESSAVGTLRTLNTAQQNYQIIYGGYADDLAKLGGNAMAPTAARSGLVDWVLGCMTQPCPKSGFTFLIINAVGAPQVNAYGLIAVPMDPSTGRRSFCSDQMSIITFDPNAGNPPVCTRSLQ
ncbi:MAG: prepilin-type N-terminal cleavage/methylation domain-containing protein [Acidobacteriota bacterium]|nr:prepilin-type N-terminal cleavage/methylation domain-containing protein [Acidobacteriota bacterium]